MTRRYGFRTMLCALAAGAAAVVAGCRSDYAADLRNLSPQPVYAEIRERNERTGMVLAQTRLGPGDRGVLGPVRARTGRAFLIADTKPNPVGAVTFDLNPGVTSLEITLDATDPVRPAHTGQLRIRDVSR